MSVRRATITLALCVGCDGAAETVEIEHALDPFAMVPVDPDADPLSEHRPAQVFCPPPAWGEEGGGFEVQTGICNYAAFHQPLPTPLRAGDELHVIVWHDLLDAAEPATAHLAMWVGETVVWEQSVNIPAPSASLEATVGLRFTPAEDARVGFHLHNHGFNTWRLDVIDIVRH